MMNNILSKIVIFTAGAAVGSAVTWKLVKDKYEQMAQEDIRAIRKFYLNKEKNSLGGDTEGESSEEDEESEEDEKPKTPTQRDIYTGVVNTLGYSGQEPPSENNEEEDEDMSDPYVISPSEYGELEYETESLWYFEGDGVVTTYFGEVIDKDDIPDMIGADFAEHYGEYEEDSVHVRNDKLKIDFEILRDLDAYSEKSK